MKKQDSEMRLTKTDGGLPYDLILKALRFGFSKLGYLLIGLLFARVRFFSAVSPLALSLAAGAGQNGFWYAAGGLTLTLIEGDLAGAGGLLTVLLLRLTFWRLWQKKPPLSDGRDGLFTEERLRGLFGESLTLRLAAATVGGFTVGALRTVLGGFSLGDFFGILFYLSLTPLFAFLFFAARAGRNAWLKKGGQAVFCTLLVYAVAPFSLFGFSFAYLLASLFAFAAAKREKPAVAGVFGGLLLLPISPVYAFSLGFGALGASLLYPRATLYAVCGGSILFAALAFLAGDARTFAAAFPEVLSGAILTVFLTRKRDAPGKESAAAAPPRDLSPAFLSAEAAAGEKQSMLDLADSFAETATLFFSLSDRAARAQTVDAPGVCARAFDRLCRRCPAASVCFGRAGTRAADALAKAGARLAAAGQVEKADLPPEFTEFCPHADEIVEEIGIESVEALGRQLKNDAQFSTCAGALSALIRHALSENERAYAPDPAAKAAVSRALAAVGFFADALSVFGERQKTVYAWRLSSSAMQCDVSEIKAALSRALDCPFEDPLFEFADGGIRMICKSLPRYAVTYDLSAAAEKAGAENGDSVRVFEGRDGYTYALISDGMGRGPAAAGKSRRAALFLEKMLSAGNSVRTSIELLSVLLRQEDTEGFTTVDLLEIDRRLGRVCFFKSGAAPSFVRRDGRIFKIRSRTFPIGILEDVDAEKNAFAVCDGDIIVMVSDGIVGEYDEPLWLCQMLSDGDLTPEGAARRIRRAAEAHATEEDDRTVCVLQITAVDKDEKTAEDAADGEEAAEAETAAK
ncbi:MAG: SpoIIE family protein phosphatase [Clostridia bacterium]|nr:SpoIIE family protein phosphatase [Clostridia bacterium]